MSLQLEAQPEVEIVVKENEAFDLIIIGGGPAGLAASIYALRAKLNVLLVEKMVLGGMLSTAYRIENYPGFPEAVAGLDLSQKMTEQAQKLGLKISWSNAVKVSQIHNKRYRINIDGKTVTAPAVIIATGTDIAELGVPGEKEFRGKGVSYCATCDGPFYRDKNVMVVGGGNAAIEEALFLTRFARKVSIVHRRDELRADRVLADQAKSHPKIYFLWHSSVEAIKGDKMVKEVVLKDLTSHKKLNVPIEGVFVYVGRRPNSGPVKELVKTDDKGFIITDEKMQTSSAGIFAAGDVRAKSLRQVVTAVSDGATAANSAREYLTSKPKGV